MKQVQILFVSLLMAIPNWAQTAENAPLPDKFSGIPLLLNAHHFPSPVYASMDVSEPETYFWKHNTTFFSPTENITIEEGGAYIFYNQQWNLRVAYSSKEIAKLFNIPKGEMKAGQPYTFVENWRRDNRLLGGWAMWYVIGKTADGQRIAGIGKLETIGEKLPIQNAQEPAKLSLKKSEINWTGKAAFSDYGLSGTLAHKSGNLVIVDGNVTATKLIIDMKSLDADNKDLKKHLRAADFFEVKKYPEARFELVESFALKNGQQLVKGLLTIKEKTEEVAFLMDLKEVKEGWQVSGTLVIDRTKFGITYNSPTVFENLKDQAIADEMEVAIQLFFE